MLLPVACAAAALAAGPGGEPTFDAKTLHRIFQHSPLPEPPPSETNRVADDPRAAALGRRLFFDPRLSADGTISCSTCHDPARGFTDGRPVAEGLGTGTRNALSLWNAAYQRWHYWDGREDTLWAQALSPIENPVEMGGSRRRTLEVVSGDPELRAAYEALFGPVPGAADDAAVDAFFANVGKTFEAYERGIVGRRAPFDVFVEGLRTGDREKLAALSPSAQRGLAIFMGRGNCRLCHTGPAFTDGEFHNIGVPPRAGGLPRDPGRYRGVDELQRNPFNATGAFSDDPEGPTAQRTNGVVSGPHLWGSFRTPSLRNVALTAPYGHQGQFETLRDVVRFYSTLEGAVQLSHHRETILTPLDLSDQEIADLVAFLESLTDASALPGLVEQE